MPVEGWCVHNGPPFAAEEQEEGAAAAEEGELVEDASRPLQALAGGHSSDSKKQRRMTGKQKKAGAQSARPSYSCRRPYEALRGVHEAGPSL